MCPHNPITELLNEIKHSTKKTNLTIQDVLNIAQHRFYRTRGRGGPLKTRSREKLKPLVNKYRMNPQDPSSSFFATNNKSEAQPREIHIWEFPHDFRVQLEPKVMKELANRAAENVGDFGHLASILKVHKDTLSNYRIRNRFIPLPKFLQLCELAGDEFVVEKMESHIIAYKGGPNTEPIQTPKIPIRETPKLFGLMGHLTGDGGYSGSQAYYGNTNQKLIREFLEQLHVVFGGVPIAIDVHRCDKATKDIFIVRFGRATIVQLLCHIYKVDFRTFTAKVPQRLFHLPKEYGAAYIRAYADDEGYVDDLRITIGSANEKLIQDVYRIIQMKFPDMSEFVTVGNRKNGKRRQYYIRFKPAGCADYQKFIGFTHPEKRRRLDRILTRRKKIWKQRNEGVTRRMILEALKIRPMTTYDLVGGVEIVANVIRRYLKELVELGFVRESEKAGYAKVFEITEQGRKVLSLPWIGFLSLRRGARRRIELLRTLQEGTMTAKQLGQKLGIHPHSIRFFLDGRNNCKYEGLVKLGLVKRVHRGGRFTSDIYCLTEEGKRFLEELETHFPEIWNSP